MRPNPPARRGPDDTNRSVEIAGHGNSIHANRYLTPVLVADRSLRDCPLSCLGDLHPEHLRAACSSQLGKPRIDEVAELHRGEALLEQRRLRAAAGVTREKAQRARLLVAQGRHTQSRSTFPSTLRQAQGRQPRGLAAVGSLGQGGALFETCDAPDEVMHPGSRPRPRPESVGILRAVSAAARAPDDVTPPARNLVRIGAKLAARASALSDWAWLPLVRACIISHQYLAGGTVHSFLCRGCPLASRTNRRGSCRRARAAGSGVGRRSCRYPTVPHARAYVARTTRQCALVTLVQKGPHR